MIMRMRLREVQGPSGVLFSIAVSEVLLAAKSVCCFRHSTGNEPPRPRPTMSALRLVSTVARRAPGSFALGRRGYAEATDKIKLSLVLPHQVRLLHSPAELSITPTRCRRRSSPRQMLCRSICRRPLVIWVSSQIMSHLSKRSGLAS